LKDDVESSEADSEDEDLLEPMMEDLAFDQAGTRGQFVERGQSIGVTANVETT
jgi:hypothetical protein